MDVSEDAPAVLRDAATPKQLKSFQNLSWVVRKYGKTQLQVAHPSYHVLSEGNAESTQALADFVAEMAHHSSTNFSFAFDHQAGIGQSLRFKGTPTSLQGQNTKRVFSLGGDGAGLGLHAHGATFLALLTGQKLWFIAPPAAVLAPELLDPVHAHGIRLKRIADSFVTSGCHASPKMPADAASCASSENDDTSDAVACLTIRSVWEFC